MDDPRWEPGMPVLDRQPVLDDRGTTAAGPAPVRVPDRIPETAPTPLQSYYINLSAIALVAGAIAITALETGSALGSPLVKLCVLIAGPLLVLANGDAVLRIWRSAWAWMPIDRGRGLFRLSWVLAGTIGLLVIAAASLIVLLA
ncbi:MAG TPA: hypothetical protein VJ506_06580 [Candidatus Limnocylindrales bacterium]|nr:hypothetical protein [Candidatus Limnocylindrales bacterium]